MTALEKLRDYGAVAKNIMTSKTVAQLAVCLVLHDNFKRKYVLHPNAGDGKDRRNGIGLSLALITLMKIKTNHLRNELL